ncbi:hypothetical protein [Marimonas arenosa]|uniref:Uncharacterized protein n=1 Tax=Marimonas arenosa TaxID=1795305 RepID=A0AAE4B3S5_9RHOB|nr:hypothetical protein [Marimonas arenosa]MDQ2089495.1 hypothetical protein [Marimonas arenosa]
MTRTIFAHLQLWDPVGQMKIDPDLTYGGQTMLFVLAAEDLVTGIEKLLQAVQAKGLGLVRLMHAGFTEDFEPDHFPFEVDLAPMIRDAEELDKICALPPVTFSPNTLVTPLEVTVAILDLAADKGTGGALTLAAIQGSVAAALPRLLDHIRSQGLAVRSIEDVKDATEHSEGYGFEIGIEDLVNKARETDGPVFSEAMSYGAAG